MQKKKLKSKKNLLKKMKKSKLTMATAPNKLKTKPSTQKTQVTFYESETKRKTQNLYSYKFEASLMTPKLKTWQNTSNCPKKITPVVKLRSECEESLAENSFLSVPTNKLL